MPNRSYRDINIDVDMNKYRTTETVLDFINQEIDAWLRTLQIEGWVHLEPIYRLNVDPFQMKLSVYAVADRKADNEWHRADLASAIEAGRKRIFSSMGPMKY